MFVIEWNGIESTVNEWDGDEGTLAPDPDPEKLNWWDGTVCVYPSKTDAMHDILDYLETRCKAFQKRMIQIYGEIEAEYVRLKPVKRCKAVSESPIKTNG